mmetsp:Transcript_23586/g.54500  ORF Transcript_23586/g.54500 Transcript_23586/m.54500 type:complete len:210 (+) Transcript_23586:831-1460(+)
MAHTTLSKWLLTAGRVGFSSIFLRGLNVGIKGENLLKQRSSSSSMGRTLPLWYLIRLLFVILIIVIYVSTQNPSMGGNSTWWWPLPRHQELPSLCCSLRQQHAELSLLLVVIAWPNWPPMSHKPSCSLSSYFRQVLLHAVSKVETLTKGVDVVQGSLPAKSLRDRQDPLARVVLVAKFLQESGPHPELKNVLDFRGPLCQYHSLDAFSP